MSGTRNRKGGSWRSGRGLLAAALTCAVFSTALAEETAAIPTDLPRAAYEQVSRELTLSAERMAEISEEIAAVRKDHATITAALIQSAKTEKKLSQDIEGISSRLETLRDQETGIKLSLKARRSVLAEVLGALQRMGLNPPPAILVKPEDALASVRSAILLGAVVPELRSETEILVEDLDALAKVAASIDAEKARLVAAVEEQTAEKQRLSLLLAEKQRLQGEREMALAAEQKRSEELAAKAKSLKGLIAALEQQAAEAEARRLAEAAQARREAELAMLPVPETNRLVESAPFSALKRQVALPVTGRIKRRFGGDDGNGGVMLGDMVATQSGAIVTAPSDASVLYAGPFRSYGQLLILNAGDGYHVVLAGMNRISVALGQSVLAGEPVGAMGEARVASTSALPDANIAPELYIEFRKDGKPVDPTPWWADRVSGRTGNGT